MRGKQKGEVGEMPLRVSDLLNVDGILLHAKVTDAADALGVLVELQEKSGAITNGAAYYNAVCDRENTGGTTAIGGGMAIPHACNAGAAALGVAAMTLCDGIDWGAQDGEPVDLLFMIAVPPNDQSNHLQILARLVSLLSEPSLVTALRAADDSETFLALLAESELERFA